MYVVIFKARLKQLSLDEQTQYNETAVNLRDLALTKYGCLEFISNMENNTEIALSYWKDKAAIKLWKENSAHQKAQILGKDKWYTSYQVQIAKLEKDYCVN